MGTLTTFDIASAAVNCLVAVVWAAIAVLFWGFVLCERRRLRIHWFVAIASTLFAVHWSLHVVEALTPTRLGGHLPALEVLIAGSIDVATLVSVPLFLHLMLHDHDQRASLRFLLVTYGGAALVGVAALALLVTGGTSGPRAGPHRVLTGAYSFVGLAVAFVLLLRRVRPTGSWRQGSSLLEVRLADIVAIVVASMALAAMVVFLAGARSASIASWGSLFFHTVVGLTFAVPVAARTLGRFLSLVGRLVVLLPLAVAIVWVGQTHAAAASHPEIALLWNAATVGAVLLMVPAAGLVGRAVDRLLFGGTALRHAELQEVLRGIPPEAGRFECCRRACAGLARVMDLSGTAVLFADAGDAVAYGNLPVERLAAVWPRSTDAALPDVPLREIDLFFLGEPLRSALMETEVVRIVPVRGRRRVWGHLLTAERLLARPVGEADEAAIAAFADQLGALLDAAELLAHAVEVERSLAHAEKLAALGELSARIAHEIRNPVTAARSLAQQLAREPALEFASEHRLILDELERVERQIALLLRFARREEYQLDRGDLSEAVRATAETLRPLLSAAGIELGVEVEDVHGRFDSDKVRQVVVNLVENARDALAAAGTPGGHVWITLGRHDGVAQLRIADDGPGVPDEELPRLFEPFYSRKPQGTGLGLAIVRRTVEAHGGKVVATRRAGGGLRFDVELPLGAAQGSDG